jgi:hypothetical protein
MLSKIVDVAREKMAYRGLETITVKLLNGDEIEVKAWDNERLHSRMDYSVKLVKKDGTKKELVVSEDK